MEVECVDSGGKGATRAVKDCVAGTFGGIVQVLVGQPFDTVKVRLQIQSSSAPLYNGAVDCVVKTVRQEGPLALYKGTLTPLLGVGACVSIQFGALEYAKRLLGNFNSDRGLKSNLSIPQLIIAGVGAGLANSVISGPVEHIRTRLQVQTKPSAQAVANSSSYYYGPLDAVKKIYRQRGVPGIFKGQGVTMWREAFGYGIYFSVYEYLVQNTLEKENIKRSELAPWKSCLFGAISGYILWVGIYPIDVVKSKIQTDSLLKSEQKFSGMIDCFAKVYKSQGLKGLYRGFIPCMARAGPANAATFVAVEAALNVIGRN